MAAPKGNKFWLRRTKHGRDKIFKSSRALWEACCEYFEWCENNPLEETRLLRHELKYRRVKVPKMRAMTLKGLFLFIDIHHSTWEAWRQDNDFSEIVDRVEYVIRTQKFQGAAAGLLNSAIVARELGLKDGHDLSSSDGTMTPQSTVITLPAKKQNDEL